MSDIIANAKQLLGKAEPAPWVVYERSFGVIDAIGPIERDPTEGLDVDSGSAELVAAAPELAQALAEETYEYSYQELRGDEWETAFNDVTHLEEWWPKKSDVDWIVEEARKHGYVCRLVRRRISPVEIVNE